MGNMLKDLIKYFRHTPKEIIEKDMKDLDKYNETGPDMLDILPNEEQIAHKDDVSKIIELSKKIDELKSFIESLKYRFGSYSYFNGRVSVPKELDEDIIKSTKKLISNLQSELNKYTITKE